MLNGSIRLSTNSLEKVEKMTWSAEDMFFKERITQTKRFKCSINTCKLTSSVKIACPALAPAVEPYIVVDI